MTKIVVWRKEQICRRTGMRIETVRTFDNTPLTVCPLTESIVMSTTPKREEQK